MAKAPAFQWYPGDYLSSARVSMMTLEEEGAYIRLLSYCWQTGFIPADPVQLARLIGKGASTTLATTVATMFIPDPSDGGRLIHERLEDEREKQRIWREKSANGGRKSAEMRRNTKGASTTLEPESEGWLPNGANQTATLQSPSPSPSPSPNINTPRQAGKCAVQIRAEGLMRRRPTTPLTSTEQRALKSNRAVLVNATEEEWALLEWWYRLPQENAPYRKTNFAALLNNWHAEVEKARRNKNTAEHEMPRVGVNVA